MRTITVTSRLDTSADRVWSALQHPSSFLYVVRGLFRMPALEGRTDPCAEGESGSGWLLLFHVVPLHRHTINIVQMDQDSRTIRTREHGGVLKEWNHTLQVKPVDTSHCQYTDTVELDAGRLTPVMARVALWIYRYRHRRWRRLVRRHLQISSPARTASASTMR